MTHISKTLDSILKLPKRAVPIFPIGKDPENTSLDIAQSLARILLKKKPQTIVHVAGTNGKGSVCYKIASALAFQGYSVGLFTSPHLIDPFERIQVVSLKKNELNFACIDSASFDAFAERVLEAFALIHTPPTFFEVFTFISLLYYENLCLDHLVIETGVGGRFDTTNALEADLSIITSLSFDHQHLLGQTLEEIAWHKAGIIKNDKAVVLGCFPYKSILRQIELTRAQCIDAFLPECLDYEIKNRNVAKKGLDYLKKRLLILDQSIDRGLEVTPFARFTELNHQGCDIILDVAHNPEGIEHLLERLKQTKKDKKWAFCVAFSEDKDIEKTVELLTSYGSIFYIPQIDLKRMASPHRVKICMEKFQGVKTDLEPLFSNHVKSMIQESKTRSELLVVTGSFYLVSAFLKELV